jgi:hypothetical protein
MLGATTPHIVMRPLRYVAVAVLALAGLGVPATPAAGAAEQIRIDLVDEPAPWEFDDPCTGDAVHGVGLESGTIHIVELGEQGHHDRVKVDGTADLYDDDEVFVGTWTYTVNFGDQFPPDAQGAVTFRAVGPVEYADGTTAVVTLHGHQVFDKGDTQKREFFKATCR